MMLRVSSPPQLFHNGRIVDTLGWERLTTAKIAHHRRLKEWNSFGSERICAMTVDPLHEDFDAEIARVSFGRLALGTIRSTPASASALGRCEQGSADTDALLLVLPSRGLCANEQQGQVSELAPGTILLRDLLKPWVHSSKETIEMLTIKLPYADLQTRIDDPLCLTGQVHSAATPEVAVTIDLIRSVHQNLLRAPDGPWRNAMADLVLDSVSILARMITRPAVARREGESLARLRRDAMRLMCRQLADPDLSVSKVAAALGTSPRCLQRAFAAAGESPTSFLQAQRLDHAASLLRAGRCGAIIDVAMATGFNDAAHFSRLFARRFGRPPSRFGKDS